MFEMSSSKNDAYTSLCVVKSLTMAKRPLSVAMNMLFQNDMAIAKSPSGFEVQGVI